MEGAGIGVSALMVAHTLLDQVWVSSNSAPDGQVWTMLTSVPSSASLGRSMICSNRLLPGRIGAPPEGCVTKFSEQNIGWPAW